MSPDPFVVLGLPRTATLAEARRAYRRLALRHHPDHNPGDARAGERFKRVLRAYRRIASGAYRRSAPAAPPAAPRPDRYGCARCGDTFAFAEACPRCAVPLRDRALGETEPDESPRVQAMIADLERRVPRPDPLERLPVPGILVGGFLGLAAVLWQLGPVGPAALCLGFGAYVAALEAHRRLAPGWTEQHFTRRTARPRRSG